MYGLFVALSFFVVVVVPAINQSKLKDRELANDLVTQ